MNIVRLDTPRLDGKTPWAKRPEQIVVVTVDQSDEERNLREGARRDNELHTLVYHKQ